jgi:hypothetical protein
MPPPHHRKLLSRVGVPPMCRRKRVGTPTPSGGIPNRGYPNRSGLSAERSTDGLSFETISETSAPVTGAMLTPIMA